jgi:hypothetical protein
MFIQDVGWAIGSIVATFHNIQEGLLRLATWFVIISLKNILGKFLHVEPNFLVHMSYYCIVLLSIL